MSDGQPDKSKNTPKVVADIGATVEDAFAEVVKSLPFAEGHKAYLSFKRADTELVSGVLVTITYQLKPGYTDKAVQAGTGAYRTGMERRHNSSL